MREVDREGVGITRFAFQLDRLGSYGGVRNEAFPGHGLLAASRGGNTGGESDHSPVRVDSTGAAGGSSLGAVHTVGDPNLVSQGSCGGGQTSALESSACGIIAVRDEGAGSQRHNSVGRGGKGLCRGGISIALQADIRWSIVAKERGVSCGGKCGHRGQQRTQRQQCSQRVVEEVFQVMDSFRVVMGKSPEESLDLGIRVNAGIPGRSPWVSVT